MDLHLLRSVVSEAVDRLSEQEILRIGLLGLHRYLLRFATAERDNLLLSVRPEMPRLLLLPRGARFAEIPPDRFAAEADRALAGARLASIGVRGDDRVVEMRFRLPAGAGSSAGRVLVAELFGRSANALLLDESGVVLSFARNLQA